MATKVFNFSKISNNLRIRSQYSQNMILKFWNEKIVREFEKLLTLHEIWSRMTHGCFFGVVRSTKYLNETSSFRPLWISVIEFENPIVTILRWIIFFVMNFGGKFENIYFWWVNYERWRFEMRFMKIHFSFHHAKRP